jgi:AcrR family transcriptional regulator
MSPRLKAVPDDEILDATGRLLERLGPARLRLEDVAREVGLSPATLLLRFGSKRGLLLAMAKRRIACMNTEFAARRAEADSPLEAIAEVGTCLTRLTEAPQLLSNSLAFLQLSLEDEEFRRLTRRHARTLAAEVRGLVAEARAAGELIECSIPELARAIIAMSRGSLITWTASGTTVPADRWLRGNLETLLRPYRTSRPAQPPARRRHARSGRARKARSIRS